MKKLICALVLLAMLVPVVAMAASVNTPKSLTLQYIDQNDLWNEVRFERDGAVYYDPAEGYTCTYYASTGFLRDRGVDYFCEDGSLCSVRFTPGNYVVDIINIVSQEHGPSITYMWNRFDEKWFNMEDPEDIKDHHNPFEEKFNVSPYTAVMYNDRVVPTGEEIAQYMADNNITEAKLKNGLWAEMKKDDFTFDKDTGMISIDLSANADIDQVYFNRRLMKKTETGVFQLQAQSHMQPVDGNPNNMVTVYHEETPELVTLIDVQANALTHFRFKDNNTEKYVFISGLRMNGDILLTEEGHPKFQMSRFEKNADGEYVLESYGVRSADLSSVTNFDQFNRLESHEYWAGDFTYWCYEKDEKTGEYGWSHSYSPDMPWTAAPEVPTPEVIRSLNLSDVQVEYSLNDVKGDSEGLPAISGSALKGADVKVVSFNNPDNEEITTFDITPMKGGEAVQPSAPLTMYLPLPNGFDETLAKEYGVTIEHKGEVFSTLDGSATITSKGMEITATSFSPYNVLWGESGKKVFAEKKDDVIMDNSQAVSSSDLPSTGDTSNLLAFICLLAVSAGALLALNKRRAHQ